MQIVGVSGLTLAGSLEVDLNRATDGTSPVVDFTRLSGNGLAIATGAATPAVTLGFSGNLLQASGSLTLGISGFAYITGNFAFQKGGSRTVTLQDSTTRAVSVLDVGVSDVYAFAGVNGPYWINNPGEPIRGPTMGESVGAMGVALSNASLGLALMKPVPTTSNPNPTISYLALKVSGSVAFVGISGLTLSANNLSIEVNQASDSSNPAQASPPSTCPPLPSRSPPTRTPPITSPSISPPGQSWPPRAPSPSRSASSSA